MNHREPPSLPTSASRALRYLSLLLLPMLAPEAATALARPRHTLGLNADEPGGDALPYLAVVGAPPLRFQRAAPPPDVVPRPTAGAPPMPPLTAIESTVALANTAAAQSTTAGARLPGEVAASDRKLEAKPATAPAKAPPAAILPDDTRPVVRPEDFLPYFQVPGAAKSAGEVNVIMPANAFTPPAAAPLPPSSATYTQSPR